MSCHLSLAQSEAELEFMVVFLSALQPVSLRIKTQKKAELMQSKGTVERTGLPTIQPSCHSVKTRRTTTSRHQSVPTPGNARPKRSCATHNRRWMGVGCCGADCCRTRGAKHRYYPWLACCLRQRFLPISRHYIAKLKRHQNPIDYRFCCP